MFVRFTLWNGRRFASDFPDNVAEYDLTLTGIRGAFGYWFGFAWHAYARCERQITFHAGSWRDQAPPRTTSQQWLDS